MYFTFRSALQASTDIDLENRLAGVQGFMQREFPRFQRARLWHEFEENVQLRPGGEMIQISDSAGAWIFQSQSMQGLKLAAPRKSGVPGFATLMLQSVPVRIRTASVRVLNDTYNVQLATALGPPHEAMTRFFRVMVAFIPALVLAASAGGYWLSRRALAPVDRIIQDSRNIGHHNLSQRLMVPQTGDELQRLSQTLNDMIQRLEAAFQRITRFTADASHELRTPVAFIRTTAEVALLQPRDPASYHAAMQDVLSEAERMTKLIEDLLTLARADSSAFQFQMASIDVREPLQHAGAQALTCANGKNIRFSAELPKFPIKILGDPTALHRLFLIFLDNAIKYTPVGGSIEVRLFSDESDAVVSVRDSGIGIAEDDLGRIFERFYRSDKARHRDSEGAGLGLSIARWIVDAHRAQIQVASKLGLGSDFTVRFAKAN